MDRDTLLELIPAYALDALDDDERLEVATLLETDAEARQLLQDYRAVVEVLPLVVSARQAPASTRTGLQQRLAERRSNQTISTEKSVSKVRTLPRRWVGLGAAAAVFLVAIIGFVVVQLMNQPTEEERRIAFNRETYYALVETEGTQLIPIEPQVEGLHGDLVISPDGEQVILRLAELPKLGENQAYQLWARDAVDLQSAGLFHWKDGHGPYYVMLELAKPIDQYQGFGMTIEPEAGSPLGNAPSGEGIWRLALASPQ
jgi:anti-sigma-K factor RskA